LCSTVRSTLLSCLVPECGRPCRAQWKKTMCMRIAEIWLPNDPSHRSSDLPSPLTAQPRAPGQWVRSACSRADRAYFRQKTSPATSIRIPPQHTSAASTRGHTPSPLVPRRLRHFLRDSTRPMACRSEMCLSDLSARHHRLPRPSGSPRCRRESEGGQGRGGAGGAYQPGRNGPPERLVFAQGSLSGETPCTRASTTRQSPASTHRSRAPSAPWC